MSNDVDFSQDTSTVIGKKKGKKPDEIEHIIQQNSALKSELVELAKQMDEHCIQQKQGKEKEEHPPELQEKQNILKQQQVQISNNQKKIQKMKKTLENLYDIDRIIEKENELKNLKRELQVLIDEKNSLMKIEKQQSKAIDSLTDECKFQIPVQQKKHEQIKEQLRILKNENKTLDTQLQEKEKNLRILHEQTIIKETKIKDIQQKIKERKLMGDLEEVLYKFQISDEQIQELQKKYDALKSERDQIESQGLSRVKELEHEKRTLQMEYEKKQIILKSKQKQSKLNQIKIKEIMRIAKYGKIQGKKLILDNEIQTVEEIGNRSMNNEAEKIRDIEETKNTKPVTTEPLDKKIPLTEKKSPKKSSQKVENKSPQKMDQYSPKFVKEKIEIAQLKQENQMPSEPQEQVNKAFSKPMLRKRK